MNTLPVRDLLSRDFVGVNESDGVLGAVELMREAGETAAVVLRGQQAAGVLTAEHVLDYLLEGKSLESTPVAEIMDKNPTTVSPETTLEEAARALVGANDGHLLVTNGSEVIGVLDPRDLATARPPDAGARANDTAGGLSQQASAVQDGYSNQSICEGCGSFSQDLVNVDGQLLCPDCRTV
ncbi:MAG: CBS domain-containing protein [Halodesulfurarchaeum sp.]